LSHSSSNENSSLFLIFVVDRCILISVWTSYQSHFQFWYSSPSRNLDVPNQIESHRFISWQMRITTSASVSFYQRIWRYANFYLYLYFVSTMNMQMNSFRKIYAPWTCTWYLYEKWTKSANTYIKY